MVGFPGKYIGLASILENAGSTVSRDEREQCVFNTLALLRQTRMHPVGCVPSAGGRGWCLPGGGGLCPRGVYPSMHWGRHPRSCGQNTWHTLLKILPCRNFAADGNYNRYHTGRSSGSWVQDYASFRGWHANNFHVDPGHCSDLRQTLRDLMVSTRQKWDHTRVRNFTTHVHDILNKLRRRQINEKTSNWSRNLSKTNKKNH